MKTPRTTALRMKLTREDPSAADARAELDAAVGRRRSHDRRIFRHDDERVNEVHERLIGQSLERCAVPSLDSAGGAEAIPANLRHLQSADALMRIPER